jgi:hypothetical protein
MNIVEILETAVLNGEYKKIKLAQLVSMSKPTLIKFLLGHPDIEAKREANEPKIKEKGRRKYLADYHKTYVRPDRKTYFKKYREAKNLKNTEGVFA